jgi:hypothetical protein
MAKALHGGFRPVSESSVRDDVQHFRVWRISQIVRLHEKRLTGPGNR